MIEASTPRSRLLGLARLRLREMPDGHALLLGRCRSVHTIGMRFPLDLIFLGRGGEVVDAHYGVPPGRIRTSRDAVAVLEIPHRGRQPVCRLDHAALAALVSPPSRRAAPAAG